MDYADKQAWAMGEGYSSDFAKAHATGQTPRRFLARRKARKPITKPAIAAASFGPVS